MRRVVKIFVSSPGDVKPERDQLTAVVNEFNEAVATIAPEKGIGLELIRWETHVPPGIHERGPQGVVTDYIPEYDIFVGIMWKRFGTPTPEFGSGTEEEFRDAYARWEKTKKTPHLMFYFCQADLGYMDDPEEVGQFQQVLTFRAELNKKGLMQSYSDRAGFAGLVRHQLNLVLAPVFSGRESLSEVAQKVGSVALANDDTIRARVLELAREYRDVRLRMAPSDERTRRMEVIVSQMRTLALTAYPMLAELTQSVPLDDGRDPRAGERLAAVALLQSVPNPDYIEWLAGRVGEERPFLGYHAAVALLTAARAMGGVGERARLKAAIERAAASINYVREDADRKIILNDALAELGTGGPDGRP
ncbi:MAG TPA: DUF4062 domain-containing protein [Pyrinomonadaceae bacterium]